MLKGLSFIAAVFTTIGLLAGCPSSLGPGVEWGPDLESFQTATNVFPNGQRYWTDFVVANGHVYVCGGDGPSDFLSDVQYASIESSGDVGSFSATTSLPEGRAYHCCVVYGGYFYVISGITTGALDPVADIVYAPINSDGSLGTFSTATGTLNTARAGFYATAYSGYLYVFGGTTGGIGTRSVEYAQIQADGDLGSFAELTNHTTSSRSFVSGARSGGYVYLAGGRKSGSEDHDTVEYALLDDTGGVGTFSECSSKFTDSRENLECAVHNGYLYVIAGYSIDSTPSKLSDIQYAEIDPPTGDIGSFNTSTSTLSSYRWHGGTGVWNHTLYVIGGGTTTGWNGDLEYASFEQN